jgi:hypothetical protein
VTGKVHTVDKLPNSLVTDGKLKDPTDVASVFKNLCITITEELNIQQKVKSDATSILEDSFPGNVPRIEIITITEAELQSIIYLLTPQNQEFIINQQLKQ